MANFHHSERVISRSTGRNTVQVAAYISREKIKVKRRRVTANFRKHPNKAAVWAQLAPEEAPGWCRELQFWDVLEPFEDHWASHYLK
jgi:hypothetical protein